MPRSLFTRDKSDPTTDLITADGTPVSLPRASGGTDFSGTAPCTRCGGHACKPGCGCGIRAERDGEIRDGVIVICHVDPHGVWCRRGAACSCVFGAWRRQFQRIEYADRLQDVPPDLTQGDWTALFLAHSTGDTYADAVDKLGSLCSAEDRERIARVIIDWMRTDPPAYDPDLSKPRRKPETPKSRYEREPASSQEILAGMPAPRQEDPNV